MKQERIAILALESSCDDTAAAVMVNGKILANKVANQQVHEQYGGVVPELASRAHQQNIIPVVEAAINEAGITLESLDAIAFTSGPGLIGSLLVGTSFSKSLALGLNLPLIEVDHMDAHVMAHFIDDPQPAFPFLCLTVSGGHTQIVKVTNYLELEVIGQTLDDAAGEAFDKTAKNLGLPYPGGPLIDHYAQQGDSDRFAFTEAKVPELNYSFSGLKTAVLYFLQQKVKETPNFIAENMADICASVQQAIITHLIHKLEIAAKQTNINEIALAGGVSANSGLRKALNEKGKELGWNTYIPNFEYCTDNAAMIAMAAHYKYLRQNFSSQSVTPFARK